MRKPRISIRVLCVLQKAEIDIQFVFYSYSTIKRSNSSVGICQFFIVFGQCNIEETSNVPHLPTIIILKRLTNSIYCKETRYEDLFLTESVFVYSGITIVSNLMNL
jgi:hypothetical protein